MIKYVSPGAPNSEWEDFISPESEFPDITIYGSGHECDIRINDLEIDDADGWVDVRADNNIITEDVAKYYIALVCCVDEKDIIIEYRNTAISF